MKELSIEEKARRYDEAIERARKFIENGDERERTIAESIFAGLMEVSEDERIKDRLINYFHGFLDGYEDTYKVGGCVKWEGLNVKDVITWLEKQGEHANFRNKIQVGDKVTRNEDGVLVNLSQLNRVTKKQSEQKTINGITKEVCKNKASAVAFLKSTGIMNENGELADEYKIEQGEQKSEEVDNLHNYLYGEQKPTWSEEDEINLEKAIWYVGNPAPMVVKDSMLVEWLKSLKVRMQPQPKKDWSEEDESHIRYLIECLEHCKKGVALTMTTSTAQEYINWLKSLRPQKQDVMSVDEFRHVVGYLVQDIVANEHMAETEKQPTNFFVEKYYNKLSSQSHWRPSDEQMEYLAKAILTLGNEGDCKTASILNELRTDLNKLKG